MQDLRAERGDPSGYAFGMKCGDHRRQYRPLKESLRNNGFILGESLSWRHHAHEA